MRRLLRQDEFRLRVKRHLDRVQNAAVRPLPFAADAAMYGLVGHPRPVETAVGIRADAELPVAGRLRIKTAQIAVHPLDDGAICIVIQAVHACIADTTVRQDGVPALPYRRRAHVDLVQPAREVLVQQQRIGRVRVPVLRQHRTQERRTDEAGREMHILLVQLFQQRVDLPLTCALRDEAQPQHQRKRRLRLLGKPPGSGIEFVQECRLDLRGKIAVIGRILALIQRGSRLCGQRDGIIVVAACDQIRIRRAKAAVLVEIVQRQPVGKMEAVRPEITVSAALHVHPSDIVRPALHVLVLGFQQHFVAEGHVDRPRNDRRRVRPRAGAVIFIHGYIVRLRSELLHDAVNLAQNIRHHERHGAAQRPLLQLHVVEILRVERRRIKIEAGRRGKDLRVSRPAHALVALRAVGRHIKEVSLLAP